MACSYAPLMVGLLETVFVERALKVFLAVICYGASFLSEKIFFEADFWRWTYFSR